MAWSPLSASQTACLPVSGGGRAQMLFADQPRRRPEAIRLRNGSPAGAARAFRLEARSVHGRALLVEHRRRPEAIRLRNGSPAGAARAFRLEARSVHGRALLVEHRRRPEAIRLRNGSPAGAGRAFHLVARFVHGRALLVEWGCRSSCSATRNPRQAILLSGRALPRAVLRRSAGCDLNEPPRCTRRACAGS